MYQIPTIFVSHGAPDVAIARTAASDFLKALGKTLPRPRAIVVVSAHYEHSGGVMVSGSGNPATIHDFGGFDARLLEITYAAKGDPALAETIAAQLRSKGFDADVEADRGFDHGTWVPLLLAYPEADIPVVQISVDPEAGPAHHFAIGEALSFLRQDGVLIMGSGSFTHNLREAFSRLRAEERTAATPAWVSDFAGWMGQRLVEADIQALLEYRRQAPFARENHPTQEHLMPLYVALGAAGPQAKARRLHDSQDYGVLSMAAFAFD